MPHCKRVSPACAPKITPSLKLSPSGDNFSQPLGCTQELAGGITMDLLVKILVMIGSSASIGFGIWHFFVPKAWK